MKNTSGNTISSFIDYAIEFFMKWWVAIGNNLSIGAYREKTGDTEGVNMAKSKNINSNKKNG